LVEQQSGGVGGVYTAIWMLPNVAGGSTVSITVTNANMPVDNHTVGMTCYDIAGLGTNPTLDLSSAATGNSSSIASGSVGPINHSQELVLASVVAFGAQVTPVGSPWTESFLLDEFAIQAYQITSSSGGTYDYAATCNSTEWTGTVVGVYAGAVASPSSGALLAMGIV
jgi:hypothetical protein